MHLEIRTINQWGEDSIALLDISMFDVYETGYRDRGIGFVLLGLGIAFCVTKHYG